MKRKKGYKVIRRIGESMFSCMVVNRIEYGSVEYQVDKSTHPQKDCGPLCIFSNKGAACEFTQFVGKIMYRCTYIPSKATRIWAPEITERELIDLPKYTVLADEVTILGDPIE